MSRDYCDALGAEDRVDTYDRHCADVAIAAYDEWFAQRASDRAAAGKGKA